VACSLSTQGLHLLFGSSDIVSFPFSGISPEIVLKDFHTLKKWGLAEPEAEGQWEITGEGREWLESIGGKETAETVLHNLTFSGSLGRIFEEQLYQLLQLSL